MHDNNDDAPRRRVSGPATLSRAVEAQRGSRPRMAPPPIPVRDPYAEPELVVRDETEGSNLGAVIAACVAGAVGALIWYGVAAITGYEIGWIAWGVGVMVGAAYHSQGGNPTLGMATCACIAILSIVGGKYLAFNTTIESELEALHESGELSRMYIWLRANGERYRDAPDKAAISRTLAAELWYDGADGLPIDAEEVAEFQQDMGPLLERVGQHETYEEFRAAETVQLEQSAEFGDMFSFIDIVFFLLGVASAIKLANGEQA